MNCRYKTTLYIFITAAVLTSIEKLTVENSVERKTIVKQSNPESLADEDAVLNESIVLTLDNGSVSSVATRETYPLNVDVVNIAHVWLCYDDYSIRHSEWGRSSMEVKLRKIQSLAWGSVFKNGLDRY